MSNLAGPDELTCQEVTANLTPNPVLHLPRVRLHVLVDCVLRPKGFRANFADFDVCA
jgi:hypothetical protein